VLIPLDRNGRGIDSVCMVLNSLHSNHQLPLISNIFPSVVDFVLHVLVLLSTNMMVSTFTPWGAG
jgi:hypothetical protein